MKKVLFLINTLGTGGAEHVLVDIVNNLDPTKFDITIKTIYDTNIYINEINKNIKYEAYYHTKKNKLLDRIFRKILYLKLMNYSSKKIYKMLIKNKYDIEIAFLEGLPTKIIYGSLNEKSKKIAWVHSDMDKNRESDIFFKNDLEQKNIYKKFDEIYCVSNQAKDKFIKRFKISKNIYTIYNIIDKQKIINRSKEEIIDMTFKNTFNLINVGRLTSQKAHIRLLEAYNEFLPLSKRQTHLYIIGEGTERKRIEEKIKELKLENNVTLLGNKINPYKYIKNANLYVCSSYAEGYSLVTMEALTLNVPVLTTNCTGQKQILNNGEFGMIVENTKKGLVEGMNILINDDNKLKLYKNNIKNNYHRYENSIKDIENQILK